MSAEPRREFVDTNILVYAFDISAGPKRNTARDLISTLWETRCGCLSVQVLQEFYNTVTRKIPTPLTSEQSLDLIREYSAWTIHAPDARDVEEAIRLHLAVQLSFWDAMVVHSASRLKCSILWSEDLSHGLNVAGIQILNPFKQ